MKKYILIPIIAIMSIIILIAYTYFIHKVIQNNGGALVIIENITNKLTNKE